MEHTVETIEYRGHNIKIYQNSMDFETPRDWDNLGTMICFHSRYNLGDKHNYKDVSEFLEDLVSEVIEEEKMDELSDDSYDLTRQEFMEKYEDMIDDNYIMLPLYLYDHSGITMNTTGFSCRWDSGQVGFIYISHKDAEKEYGTYFEEKTEAYLKGEVKVYDQYIRGEVYGYIVEPKYTNKNIDCDDSCWGFYGYDFEESGLFIEAKGSIDYEINEYIKGVIENKKRRKEMDRFIKTCWAY